MTEDQLLTGVVVAFSQQHPQKRGQLFHPANERNNQLQVYQAKAKGIHAGVSDLIYFELYHPKENGSPLTRLICTELKVVGSRHDRSTVQNQVEWGETVEANGGTWRLCTSVDDALSCYNGQPKGLTTAQVRQMLLEQTKSKIKF